MLKRTLLTSYSNNHVFPRIDQVLVDAATLTPERMGVMATAVHEKGKWR